MKQLYDLAGRLDPQRHPSEVSDSAVLSVYYGAERSFAYSRYPLWFVRHIYAASEHRDSGSLKRSQGNGESVEKKRKIRGGKKMDIGSLLGGFG